MAVPTSKGPTQRGTKDSKAKDDQRAPNPWDQRPWPTRGDKSATAIYTAVGKALSAWEEFDGQLSFFYQAVLMENLFPDPKGYYNIVVERAYTSIRTFEGRLTMVREAARSYFEFFPIRQVSEPFWKICGQALQFAARRNEIAHGHVDQFRPKWVYEEGEEKWTERDLKYRVRYGKSPPETMCLSPSQSTGNRRDYRHKPLYCYTSKDILYFESQFTKLRNRLAPLAIPLVLIKQEQHARDRAKLRSSI